jgi:hypothetical protein
MRAAGVSGFSFTLSHGPCDERLLHASRSSLHRRQGGWPDARRLPREGLAQALVESRNRTLAWLGAFGQTRRGWTVPRQYDCNPPLWTLGHIAWHAEWWCLRGVRHLEQGGIRLPVASEPSLLDGADEWFDPERIGPDERWEIALPDVSRVKQYAAQVLDGLLRRIALLPTTTTPRCTRSAARCTTRTCRGDHRSVVAGIGRSAGRAGVRGPAASVSQRRAAFSGRKLHAGLERCRWFRMAR